MSGTAEMLGQGSQPQLVQPGGEIQAFGSFPAMDMHIEYPIAIDSDYAIWSAFDNHYWPALYFVDAQGQIRHHHFGEGQYE